MSKLSCVPVLAALMALAACQRDPLRVTRSGCPAVAVPTYAGEVTRFSPAASRDASAIDLVASFQRVRGVCADNAERLGTDVSFDVIARRMDPRGARTVTLPFFASVVQGGNVIVSKQVGAVTLSFADGQVRAQTAARVRADIARSATLLPEAVTKKVFKRRRADDPDALTDPMAAPDVRAAMRATSFEVLVGFQLDDPALAYNVLK